MNFTIAVIIVISGMSYGHSSQESYEARFSSKASCQAHATALEEVLEQKFKEELIPAVASVTCILNRR